MTEKDLLRNLTKLESNCKIVYFKDFCNKPSVIEDIPDKRVDLIKNPLFFDATHVLLG